MGGVREVMSMLPGMGGNAAMKNLDMGEKEMVRVEAIVHSMTKEERARPKIISGTRRKRIANGSGTTIQDVNRLLKQFDQMKKMMKKMGGDRFTPSKKNKRKGRKKGGSKPDIRSFLGGR